MKKESTKTILKVPNEPKAEDVVEAYKKGFMDGIMHFMNEIEDAMTKGGGDDENIH